MLLHIGSDVSVPLERLLFIVNERGMTPRTRAYIERAKKERRYRRCGQDEPKSYVVCLERGREIVQGTGIASATLEKRWKQAIAHQALGEAAALIVEGTERN
ncbi:MAG: hypothetical protein Q4C13_01730 [Clostridia bacterium]|nr:hypothetical protein [Clostridia bacterium]